MPVFRLDDFFACRIHHVVRRHDLRTVFVEYILDIGVEYAHDLGTRARNAIMVWLKITTGMP